VLVALKKATVSRQVQTSALVFSFS
jgi:hypothetical protein